MKIVRYCGKERLPGGERLWRRLAKEAGYDGLVKVYGYGTAGDKKAVTSHRAYERGTTNGTYKGPTVGLHTYVVETGQSILIEVWLPCKCQVALDDWMDIRDDKMPAWMPDSCEPLFVYAHELGHAMQQLDGIIDKSETGATTRGINLLEKVIGK